MNNPSFSTPRAPIMDSDSVSNVVANPANPRGLYVRQERKSVCYSTRVLKVNILISPDSRAYLPLNRDPRGQGRL